MDDADLTDLRVEREDALRRRIAALHEKVATNRERLTNCVDCHEPLSEVRLSIGARRCIECARRCIECERAAEHEQARRRQLFGKGYEY